jgi:hypothetical protein
VDTQGHIGLRVGALARSAGTIAPGGPPEQRHHGGNLMESLHYEAGSQDARDSLSSQVEAYVRERLGGRVRDFRVTLRDGGLLLQGRSRTHHVKQLVQQAVLEIADRPIIANEIQV